MKEYFIFANSFAAPFFSDSSTHFETAPDPVTALEKFAKNYSHPCGLYSAACYGSSDDYHKNKKPLAMWNSNHVKAIEANRPKGGGYSYRGDGPGKFEIDGKQIEVADPKRGSAFLVEAGK